MCRYRGRNNNSSGMCSDCCMIGKIRQQLNRIPFQAVVLQPLPLKHVNYDDISDPFRSRILSDATNECADQCDFENCEDQYTITQVMKEEKSPRDRIRIQLEAPRSPQIMIEYEARLTLDEYLIFVSSTFGTWFGLSLLTLNPFRTSLYFVGDTVVSSNTIVAKKQHPDNTNLRKNARQRRSSDSQNCHCQYCLQTRLIVSHLNLQVISLGTRLQESSREHVPLYYGDSEVTTKVVTEKTRDTSRD